MPPELLQSLFNVSPSASAADLLGLTGPAVDADVVWKALEGRLSVLDAHPDATTPRAEEARRRLYEAARRVLDTQSQTSAPVPPASEIREFSPVLRPQSGRDAPVQLTAFDREVLAILAASGGWNKESRDRLMEVAAGYGVSGRGLLMVVAGLADHMRTERKRHQDDAVETGPIAVAEVQRDSAIIRAIDEVQTALSRELKHGGSRVTVTLSVLFGGITLVAGLVLVVSMFSKAPSGGAKATTVTPKIASAPTPEAPEPVEPISAPVRAEAKVFARCPTFQWPVDTAENKAIRDRFGALTNELDVAARRLRGNADPSEAVFREWAGVIDEIGRAWVLLERGQRDRALSDASIAFVYAEDRHAVVERLLGALDPAPAESKSVEFWGSGGLWRSAFKAGVLGDLARRKELHPHAIELIRRALNGAVGATSSGELRFESTTGAWLDGWLAHVNDFQPETPGPVVFDAWEQWLSAVGAVRAGEALQETYCRAIEAVLASKHDVTAPSPWQDVLGRLVQGLDWRTSIVVRDRYHGWIDELGIESSKVSILTSIIVASGRADWFTSEMQVHPGDGIDERRSALNVALGAWPGTANPLTRTAAKPAVAAPPAYVGRFNELLERLQDAQRTGASRAETLRRLALTAMLNASAEAMERGAADEAERLLNQVAAGDLPFGSDPSPGRPLGQPAGEDGEWAKSYQETARNHDARLQHLRMLRTRPAGDLGPQDAEQFVNEVYRASSPEIRSVAQGLLIELYVYAPTVGLELLDQFAEAPITEDLSQTVNRLTGRTLPSTRDGSWRRATRLALVEHALSLRRADTSTNEAALAVIDGALRARAGLEGGVGRPMTGDRIDPTAMARAAYDGMRGRGQAAAKFDATVLGGDPIADERRRTTRERLASGPIQRFVAEQTGALEWFGLLAANEQGGYVAPVGEILAGASEHRRQAAGALDQAVENELAWAAIMSLRLGVVAVERPPAIDAPAAPARPSTRPDAIPMRMPNASIRPSDRVGMIRTPIVDEPLEAWSKRLEALRPSQPDEYLALAEDMALNDRSPELDVRRTAYTCAALSGALAPDRLGRSACLLCAQLTSDESQARSLRAMAGLLDRRAGVAGAKGDVEGPSTDAVDAFVEALSAYRRGKGPRVQSLIMREGVMDLVNRFGHHLPGGVNGFLTDIKAYRGQSRPAIRPAEIRDMLLIQLGLLAGEDRPWSSDLMIGGDAPLVELDPSRLDLVLGVDPMKSVWRDGAWTSP